MTQSARTQRKRPHLAHVQHANPRTLAERRADFTAQVREMALSDLTAVSHRLKGLHEELNRVEAREVTQYELADKMGIRPRTFQSWENGEHENQDGTGYDKMARYYSKHLKRKITRHWILFGQEEAPVGATPNPLADPRASQLDHIEDKLDKILKRLEPAEEPGSVEEDLSDADKDAADTEKDDDEPEHTKRRPR